MLKSLFLKLFFKNKTPYYIVKGLTNSNTQNSFIYIVKKIEQNKDNTIKIKRKFICENEFKVEIFNNSYFNHYSKPINTFKELLKHARMCKKHYKDSLFYIGKF